MVQTKICPACKKEIPQLAIRCKHCGFKLPSQKRATTSAMRPPSKRMTQPIRTLTQSSKDSDESAKAQPTDSGRLQKKTMLGMASPFSSALDDSKLPSTNASQRNTFPPAPSRGTHSNKATNQKLPLPKLPSLPSANKKSDADRDSILEVDDLSSLVEMDSDSTENLSLSDLAPMGDTTSSQVLPQSKKEKIILAVKNIYKLIWAKAALYLPVLKRFLQKRLLSDKIVEKAATLPKVSKPAEKIAARLRIYHVVPAVLALLFLAFLFSSKDTKDTVVSESQTEDKQQPLTPDTHESDRLASTEEAQKKEHQKSPAQTSLATCHSINDYPEFLFDNQIRTAIVYMDKKGICDLMGVSIEQLTKTFTGEEILIIKGVDGYANASLFKFYPQKSTFPESTLSFFLIDDKVFHLTLAYENNISFDLSALEKALDTKASRGKTKEGIRYWQIEDGDMQIKLESLANASILHFSNISKLNTIKDELKNIEAANALLAQGNRFASFRNYSRAEEKFLEARQVNKNNNESLVRLAEIFIDSGQFEKARENASLAIRNTRDRRLAYRSYRVLSTYFVYKKQIKEAKKQLSLAAQVTLNDLEVKIAQKELEDKVYSTQSVALTSARMSCLEKLGISRDAILAKGNFPDSEIFFSALKKARLDARFDTIRRRLVASECR